MNIVEELLAWRSEQCKVGPIPKSIDLNEDQRRRLKEWCEATATKHIAPDGTVRESPGLRYNDGLIFGMKYRLGP